MTTETTPPDMPPTPPTPTAKDRKRFAERVKARITELGTSGRRVEDGIGMARGTLSKIYGGRLALSSKTLREVATALKIGPDVLVDDTVFAYLLQVAPPTAESEEISAARKLIDDLRLEFVGARAEGKALAAELADTTDQLRTEHGRAEKLSLQLREAHTQREILKSDVEAERALRREVEGAVEKLRALQSETQRELEAERDRGALAAQSVTAWRGYAAERAQRVKVLEAQLQQTLQRIEAEKDVHLVTTIGTTLAATLLGLGIGAAASQD